MTASEHWMRDSASLPWPEQVKLLIQTKHHRGTSGMDGGLQLAEIRREEPDDYLDYHLVLATTAAASPELAEFCEANDITVIAGDALTEWIIDNLDDLGAEWRTALGVSSVPRLVID